MTLKDSIFQYQLIGKVSIATRHKEATSTEQSGCQLGDR